LLSLLFVSAFAEADVYWKTNATLANGDLKGRTTILTEVNVPGVITSLTFASVEYQAQKGSASGDGVYGSAYSVLGGPLAAYLSYFDISASWTAGSNPSTADVSGAASLIGATYLALAEIDTDGSLKSGLRLKTLSWNLSAVVTSGPLKYATFTGTSADPNFASFSISFTFTTSDTPGILSNGAIVTSKSIQTTINILNYPFQVQTSQLRLVVGVATATASASGTITANGGFQRLVAASGKNGVYFDGSAKVIVDGNGTTKSVNVVAYGASKIDFDGAGFLSQFDSIAIAQKSLVVDFKLVNITFQGQSNNLTYDPTIGAGDPPMTNTNAASGLQVQTPLVVMFAVVAIALGKLL